MTPPATTTRVRLCRLCGGVLTLAQVAGGQRYCGRACTGRAASLSGLACELADLVNLYGTSEILPQHWRARKLEEQRRLDGAVADDASIRRRWSRLKANLKREEAPIEFVSTVDPYAIERARRTNATSGTKGDVVAIRVPDLQRARWWIDLHLEGR